MKPCRKRNTIVAFDMAAGTPISSSGRFSPGRLRPVWLSAYLQGRPSFEYEGAQYAELPIADYLRMVKVFVRLGIEKVRLTGGEPLLRKGLIELVQELAKLRTNSGERLDLALTTNGHLLEGQATKLKDAGLSRITVSMDAVAAETFERITRVPGSFAHVLRGIRAAESAGIPVSALQASTSSDAASASWVRPSRISASISALAASWTWIPGPSRCVCAIALARRSKLSTCSGSARTSTPLNLTPSCERICTTAAEKPHCGNTGVPFMKSRTWF